LLTTQKIIQNEEDNWKTKSWVTSPNILGPVGGGSITPKERFAHFDV